MQWKSQSFRPPVQTAKLIANQISGFWAFGALCTPPNHIHIISYLISPIPIEIKTQKDPCDWDVLGLALTTTFSPEWGWWAKRLLSPMSSLEPNSTTSTKLRGTLHFSRNFWPRAALPLPLPSTLHLDIEEKDRQRTYAGRGLMNFLTRTNKGFFNQYYIYRVYSSLIQRGL